VVVLCFGYARDNADTALSCSFVRMITEISWIRRFGNTGIFPRLWLVVIAGGCLERQVRRAAAM